jgi:hypothetical protein
MARLHDVPAVNGRKHEFHADASALAGNLHLPLKQDIEPQVHAHLFHTGGYLSEHSDEYRVEGAVSFKRAYSQVAGNLGKKEGHGWITLTTSVVEGLNVLEVLTADRVVGQVVTEHPLDGHMPHVSFLATRFENLRIAGHPVHLEYDMHLLGNKPDHDAPYATHPPVVEKVRKQYNNILGREDLSDELKGIYNQLSAKLGAAEGFECSLVNRAWGDYPGVSYGNVIYVRDFGTITLAKLELRHEKYEDSENGPQGIRIPKETTVTLTMIDLKLGCPIEGEMQVVTTSSNGAPVPDPPGRG